MPPSRSPHIDATGTSIEVLEYLVDADGPTGVSRVAEDLDISKSMAFNHLATLRELGYVAKRDTKYEAGLRPLWLGDRTRSGIEAYQAGREHVENLAAATGETVELFVKEERDGVPLCIVNRSADWSSPHRIGERVPLYADARGKAILASLSTERVDAILEDASSGETAADSLDAAGIKDEVRRARDSRIVFSRGEQNFSVVAIASPIEMPAAARPASLAIVGPADRFEGRYLEEDLVGQLISTSQAISVAVTE